MHTQRGLQKMNYQKAILVLKKALRLFLGKGEDVDLQQEGKLMIKTASLYRGSQWALILLVQVGVLALQKLGWGYPQVFGLLFLGNTLITGSVVILNKKTAVDFTFMEGGRNLLKEAFGISKFFGAFLELIIFFGLLLYSGADQFTIFFEDRFSSRSSKIAIFLLASCCSMAIWTCIYLGLAENFWDLLGIIGA